MFRWLKRPSTESAPPATESIRHYRITGKLGEGGMGVVYEARDERLDRLVAIKRLRNVSGDPVLRERLSREARVAAGVSHPNICQVFELGEHGGELYIVMELLTGSTLGERIARGAVPLAETLQIALAVLGALEVIHGRGIVHRDLKPSNIFLTPHGPKLLDFGVARPLTGPVDDLTLTAPGTILGTPRYLAPELFGAEPPTPAADLFALGAILFEMLTGKPAFAGSSVLEVAHAVMHGQPPALTGGPDVIAVDRVIQRALAKRALDRYQDAAAMAADIRAALTLLDTGPTPRVRTMTRLIVLPFRVKRVAGRKIGSASRSSTDTGWPYIGSAGDGARLGPAAARKEAGRAAAVIAARVKRRRAGRMGRRLRLSRRRLLRAPFGGLFLRRGDVALVLRARFGFARLALGGRAALLERVGERVARFLHRVLEALGGCGDRHVPTRRVAAAQSRIVRGKGRERCRGHPNGHQESHVLHRAFLSQ